MERNIGRKVLVFPRSTRNLAEAIEANGIAVQDELPPYLAAMVQQWREPRRVPQALFTDIATSARSDPSFFTEERMAPHYVADLTPDQCSRLVDAESRSLLALPSVFEEIQDYVEYARADPVSEATWAQRIYSQLLGNPLVAAAQMVNAGRTRAFWYMFMSDTDWTPGVFRLQRTGETPTALPAADPPQVPLAMQEPETHEVVLLKPDQFLAFIPPRQGTAKIYHTLFLAEHKKLSSNTIDRNKLLLEGCATLISRLNYLPEFQTNENLQWVPLIYCAGQMVDVILMWYEPGLQTFEYAHILPPGFAEFELDKPALLVQFHKLMHGIAEAVYNQMSTLTPDSFDRKAVIEYTRLSTKRSRQDDLQQKGRSSKQPKSTAEQTKSGGTSTSTSSAGKKAVIYPYVMACEQTTKQLQASRFIPVLALNRFGVYYGADDHAEWETLLHKLPVAVLIYKDGESSRSTFIKVYDMSQRRKAQKEATIQTLVSTQQPVTVPRILHNIRVRVGQHNFTVLEMEDAGDTTYRPRSFHELQLVMRQTLQAVAAIHNMGIVHCDLKPEHIAVVRQPKADSSLAAVAVSIIDWGMAVQLPSPSDVFEPEGSGTEGFAAPEMHAGRGCTSAVDIFSLGCTFREFARRGSTLMRYRGTPAWAALFQLVGQMTADTPSDRPSAEAALEHPFFSLSFPSTDARV